MRRKLSPLALEAPGQLSDPSSPFASRDRDLAKARLASKSRLPPGLQRLLTKEEVLLCCGPLFDRLEAVAAAAQEREETDMNDLWGHAAVCGAEQSTNLQNLLHHSNAAFLAYVRFAPVPWRFRDFLRMLCPSADDRELDLFVQWRRDQCRPCSRAGLRRALEAARLLEDLPALSRAPSRLDLLPAGEGDGAGDRQALKQFVQQRFLELMMTEGLDATSAAARALRDAQGRR